MWGQAISRGALALIALALASSLPAASVAKPARTQFLFLGTAGGPPLRVDRSEPSTLLIVNGRKYLIDCGIGTARRLVEAGIESNQIKTIFFTHLHADHDMGLADVMANDFFTRQSWAAADPINIRQRQIGPQPAAQNRVVALPKGRHKLLMGQFIALGRERLAPGQPVVLGRVEQRAVHIPERGARLNLHS